MRALTTARRRFTVGAAIASAALVLSACSSGSESPAEPDEPSAESDVPPAESDGDTPVVGATLLSLEYPFLVTLDEAMKAEADAQGIALIDLDPRQETSTEFTQIEDLITQQVDAIIMIPVDQEASQAAAEVVNEAGIPLILVNTRFTDDFGGDYVTYVGSDDTEAGQIQGEYLAEALPDGGKVIYLVG